MVHVWCAKCPIMHTRNADHPPTPQVGYQFFCTFGSRSFSILDAANGKLVYNSGADFETFFAKVRTPT